MLLHDEISKVAYNKWQAAGCPVSDGLKFWYAAENELKRKEKLLDDKKKVTFSPLLNWKGILKTFWYSLTRR